MARPIAATENPKLSDEPSGADKHLIWSLSRATDPEQANELSTHNKIKHLNTASA
jgi:hypothetical protein